MAYQMGMQAGMNVKSRLFPQVEQQIFGKDSTQHLSGDKFLAGMLDGKNSVSALFDKGGVAYNTQSVAQFLKSRMDAMTAKANEKLYGPMKKKNEDFIKLVSSILEVAKAKKGASKEEILAAPMADGRSVQDHITERSGVSGEKMELGVYEFVQGAFTTSYIHPGNMLATIVAFNEATDAQVARDVAMQIAAMAPVGITEEDVPADVKERELNLAREKAREAGKPENLVDHIAEVP